MTEQTTTVHVVDVRTSPDLAAMNPVEAAAHRWDVPTHTAVCTCGWTGPTRQYLESARAARYDADTHVEHDGACVVCGERPAARGHTWCRTCIEAERSAP